MENTRAALGELRQTGGSGLDSDLNKECCTRLAGTWWIMITRVTC